MKIPIFMIFQFVGVISAWATKALEDGKITAVEGLELIVSLGALLGVQPEFNISDYIKPVPMLDLDGDLELPDTTETEAPLVIKPEE